MQRVVKRTLPGGKTAYVSPFHLSMQGMEKLILCRDDQDDVSQLSKERKKRLIPYVYRTRKTTVPQLARALQLDREEIARTLKVSGIGTK